ncbi:enoyl-CoA hydratase/isomerase family protein [Arhodomonas aquaeolei]|uniref:enoyl-CoA hydratase/isomerase family protein n=1 Tax=Arhodomonas aquaeolei TaxID=2369 RepID=UPI000379DC99|nr:enoyl-CoA hydratase/isomerase family protein [Arhodomonas aquaeolei]
MSENSLTVTTDAGIARITMDRPAVHNAFDDALIAELTEALVRVGRDEHVHAVVLAAKGRSFSAGADLNWMRRMADYDWQENFEDSRGLGQLMHTLYRLPQPTIARVNGAAMGGGVGLVACCDIAVAADTAVFALSEVRLGLIPAVISPYVVSAIGERQARRYFVTGERFDARTARAIGLVHEVVPPEALEDAVTRIIADLRGNGPRAMREAKRLALDVSRGALDEHMVEDTAQRIADQRASDEGREGVSAFLGKRRAAWRW